MHYFLDYAVASVLASPPTKINIYFKYVFLNTYFWCDGVTMCPLTSLRGGEVRIFEEMTYDNRNSKLW